MYVYFLIYFKQRGQVYYYGCSWCHNFCFPFFFFFGAWFKFSNFKVLLLLFYKKLSTFYTYYYNLKHGLSKI
jgi:hypothetical protein